MREKLRKFEGKNCTKCGHEADIIQKCYLRWPTGLLCEGDIDELLSLLAEEVKKVENPNKGAYYSEMRHDAFESCRQAILKLLEEK